MKIWYGYGSEHSMNLVMIGHFNSSDDSEDTHELIKKLTRAVDGKIEVGKSYSRYSDDIMEILRQADCYILSPSELEHFLYDTKIVVENDKLVLTTDETEVSAFFKLMIHKGAKVEIFSAHDHPDSKYGRGK